MAIRLASYTLIIAAVFCDALVDAQIPYRFYRFQRAAVAVPTADPATAAAKKAVPYVAAVKSVAPAPVARSAAPAPAVVESAAPASVVVESAAPASVVVESAAPASVPVKSAAPAPASVQSDKAAAIVQQSFDFNPVDNSYSNSFQSENGISSQSHGYVRDGIYVVEGSYTFYSKEGIPITINYVADQNGYQAVGDSIPVPDQNIVKAVEYLRSLPPQKEESTEV